MTATGAGRGGGRRRTIGVVGLRGLPGVMGGIESHCEELYPRLLERDPSLAVVCAARRPYVASRNRYDWNGIAVVPLPSTRRQSFEAIFNTAAGVLHFGLRERPAVLHLHAIGPGLLTPLAKLLGLRVVVTHHGRDYDRAKWSAFAKAILRAGEWAAVRFADRVVAVAGTLADDLRRDFPGRADRIRYIPNGVTRLAAAPATDGDDPLARFGLVAGEYILSVGRLVPEKGFADLVAAHRASGSARPLVIAGGADHETPFVRALRAEASDNVLFTGMLPRADLGRLYAGVGLFVLASHHEGLPIAALEAAAAGAPLLLSDIAPNRDVGLAPHHHFPTADVAALAACLTAPFERYAIDAVAVAARFDWDRIAAETGLLYAELIPPTMVNGSPTTAV